MNKVKALKGFRDSESGKYVRRGGSIEVSPERQVELAKNGILPKPKSEVPVDEKAKPEPSNKRALTHPDKSITSTRILNKEAKK